MEAMNGLLSFPNYENLNQDSARVQQEQGGEWGEILLEEMNLWPHFDNTPPLDTSEVEEIVDSFFNVECYERDNANKSPNDENGEFNQYKEKGLDTQLANRMLSQIWSRVSPWGDSLQRVAYCFAVGLKNRLCLLQNVNAGSFSNGAIDVSLVTREENNEAFDLLHQTTPTLASRIEGPPKLFRITGIIGDQDPQEFDTSMKGLVEEACSLGIQLEFNMIAEPVTTIPRTSPERIKIENFHLAEQIRNVIAFEGSNRIERHERADQWRRQLARAGFQVVGMKCMSQARTMISAYGSDGYTISSEKGCLLLGWKGRPIMLASAWQVHHANSS
ncbi:unnamed protein product [Fraxinus pennsylvanica]|uniref:Uncharacterized protein n=1 Tax=Fraxinus pennsylvanica TaxID=56036 RepID=A0AAD1YUW9_9LAMI|nr:unnamed protein product [Fraxinus pennsylvanica]